MADKRCIEDRTVEREPISRDGSIPLFHLISRQIFLFQPSLLEFVLSHSYSLKLQTVNLKKEKKIVEKYIGNYQKCIQIKKGARK